MSIHEHDPVPWTEVESHFDHVLELEPEAREIWLAEMGATRPDIAKDIRALLTKLESLDAQGFLAGSPYAIAEVAPSELGDFLKQRAIRETGDLSPAAQSAEPTTASGLVAGTVVGPYRLIREIGYGGMSSVWLAERCDGQLKREVALKLPLVGPRMHVERFMRERDILGALTHPNIARLYDAGISDSGQPYLAMEYVAGTALTQSCDERRLTIQERLHVFVQVLEAVQFAHGKLIIHRDLKPSNALVTAQGRVVLLDFGIGKLLTDGVPEETPLTQIAGRALTPDYASPEQIEGQALGTASDIYSLGVILYELLTGARPYRPKRDSRAALEEAILSDDVRRPSQCEISAETAATRRTSAGSLARSLMGDLDTIVLKALKKNPLNRYVSVTAFAQDINNHLLRLPVSARPDSAWYRIGRFVSRHKIPVVAASVAVCALLSGAGLAIWQAREAAAERDRAVVFASRNEAVTEFLGRVITDAAESAKPVTVGEMLTRSEKLALGDTSNSPENRAAVLEMISDRYMSVDDVEHGTQLITSALQLVRNSPDQALRSRLTCKRAMAVADPTQSEASIRVMTHELGRLDADPDTASQCLLNLATVCAAEHRAEDALRYAKRGLERIHETGRPSGATEAALLGAVAFGYHLSGRNVEAGRYFEQALRKYKDLGRERSDGALTIMNDWAVALRGAGVPGHALQLLDDEARIETQRESGAGPSVTVLGNQARMLQALGRFERARITYELECQLATRHGDDFSEVHCQLGLASLAVETRAFDQAAAYLSRALELLGSNVPQGSPPMRVRAVLQGRIDLAAGRLAEARAQFDRALENQDASPTTLDAELGKAETELAAQNAAEAAQNARRGLQWATSQQGDLPHSSQTGLAWLMLGRALQALGDRAQAHKAFDAAVLHLSNTVDSDHPALLQARQLLGAT
jgi:serine/threonine protein kinase/tetratricopeptide (TPR) repeat protein